jgi:hypothetical protein
MALVERGNFAAACPKLEESQRLDPAVGTQYDLGLCYRRIGRLGSAWRTLRSVERLAHSTGKTGREEAAQRELASIRATASHLVFVVSEPDVSLAVDGEHVDPADYDFYPVDAGEHRIDATASARLPWHGVQSVPERDAASGAALRLAIPPLTKAVVVREASNPQHSVGIALLAVGGAGVAASVVTGVLLLSAKATADHKCTPKCVDDDGASAVRRGQTLLPINFVSWIVAGVGLGAGGFLVLRSRPRPERTAQIAPFAGPGWGGLAAAAAF